MSIASYVQQLGKQMRLERNFKLKQIEEEKKQIEQEKHMTSDELMHELLSEIRGMREDVRRLANLRRQ